MTLKELQNKLDVRKYEASAKAGKDLCGTYYYCECCNKKNKYPCAAAVKKYDREILKQCS